MNTAVIAAMVAANTATQAARRNLSRYSEDDDEYTWCDCTENQYPGVFVTLGWLALIIGCAVAVILFS